VAARGTEAAAPRFLADESCDFAVVRALRATRFDVVAVGEQAPGATDERVIELARSESRILLTEDRDFGRLVFAAGHPTRGVIFIRFSAGRRSELPGRVLDLVARESSRLNTSFTVISPERVRITALPD
jgi:predicted nuclease of predicted toxin-antitoxin system